MSVNVKEVLDTKISKSEQILKEELNTVRAGRANPALLDKVMVDYYGSPTPLKNIANISTPVRMLHAASTVADRNDMENGLKLAELFIAGVAAGKGK